MTDHETADFGGWSVDISDDDDGSTTSDTTSTTSSSDDSGGIFVDDSDSSTSTEEYDVPSGYANAAGPEADEQMQSEQLSDVDDAMEGGLDSHSVTTQTNEDGSTTLSAESNLGEEVEATTTDTPMADDNQNDPAADGLSRKQIVLGLAAAGAAAVGVSYSGA